MLLVNNKYNTRNRCCCNSLNKIKYLYSQEEFEDTKGAIRNRISKNRQHNGQKKKVQ